MRRALHVWTEGFAVWVVLFSAAAWWMPAPFAALAPGIVPGLGVIMFGMGMSLLPGDFARVFKQPRAVACGVAGQFVLMPAIAWGIAHGLGMPPEIALGFIILGCCPGGTASNVIVYLSRGNVALSVTLTACSTLLAVVLTPLLVWRLGGAIVPVDVWGLFKSVVSIVLVPVGAGLIVHRYLGRRVDAINAVFPALSVLIIVLVIAAIIAGARDTLPQAGGVLAVGVLLHNTLGLALGYGLARLGGLSARDCRTIAVEVGMQNSGLGVALASKHFSAAVALPSSIFSVVHNLTGSALANYWRRAPDDGAWDRDAG